MFKGLFIGVDRYASPEIDWLSGRVSLSLSSWDRFSLELIDHDPDPTVRINEGSFNEDFAAPSLAGNCIHNGPF
jgi:hypothetical protein